MRAFLLITIYCGAWLFGLGQVRAADVDSVKQHVAKLIAEMGSEDAGVGQKAYWDLLRLGPDAKPAVPQLVRILENRESPLRSYVASALGHILPPHVDMMELFPEMRFHSKLAPVSQWTPKQRARLERAIKEANAEAAGAIAVALPVMVKALREDEDPYVRENCARSLGACGSLAKAAVPSLIQALDDEEEPVRACAVHALADIGPDAAAAVNPLMNYLQRQKISRLRNSAIDALGRIGPAARAAVPRLIEELEHAESGRFSTATALGRIGPPAQLAIPALLKALNDEDRLLRASAAEALGNIGVKDPTVLKQLEELTTHEDSYVQHHARLALRELRPPGTVEELIASLPNADFLPRRYQLPEGLAAVPSPVPVEHRDAVDAYQRNIAELKKKYDTLKVALKPNASVFDYPGLLAKGEVRYLSDTKTYEMTIGVYDKVRFAGYQGVFGPFRVVFDHSGTILRVEDVVYKR